MMRRPNLGIIGVVAVLALSGCAGTALAADELPPTTGEFCAEMPDATGLYADNPVTQMGYRIGRVAAVQPRGDRVLVTFEIDTPRAIPADVKGVIRSKSLLADRSLELVGNYASGPRLTGDRCIALTNSYTPKTISEISASAADFVDDLAPAGEGQNVRGAVTGLADALRGVGPHARDVMTNAADAAQNPDKVIADIGSVISDMAPLSEDALKNWGAIESILTQAPNILEVGTELWTGATELTKGVAWTVATLYDIERNYGGDIWPVVHGPVTQAISLAAARAPDISSLVSTIPAVAQAVRQQTQGEGRGLSVRYTPPTVRVSDVSPELCAQANKLRPNTCTRRGAVSEFRGDALLDMVLLGGRS
ncbi:MlaD family protein [Gordonia sp. GONU]|uniref:MlaD family protein n=1 Tax=Gordonia sp. GONU TaxID=2972949 RepID=UPI0021AC0F83|nr:MlaD family protein [Gordonia sp. GONU]MCR8896698.1 MlaD family protein [Gordonia sp. GONU]